MVRFAVDARVARVWLARADKKNAFDAEMIAEITRVFRELAQRNDVHVVTLAGEGTTFSAGADLAYMKEMAQYSLEQNQDDARKLDEMFWAIRSLPQPLVGRIHGHAMGGALGITALCDFAYVEEKTKFCFSEVKLGIAPAVISPYVLEKMASAQAMRYMLSGEVFSANEALGAGLVTDVGDLAHVDAWVESCVAGLVKNGPEAMRATKTLLRRQSRLGVSAESSAQLRSETVRVIAERRVSAEGQEGLQSFFEKRAAVWPMSQSAAASAQAKGRDKKDSL